MERNVATEPIFEVIGPAIAKPAFKVEERVAGKPLLAGIIYGETVFWVMLIGMAIALVGLIIYLMTGGYFNSVSLLSYLWQGSDSLTIWKQVGNVSQPLPWYSCLGMLGKGDMLAVLGLVCTGVAAVFGVWGAFFGMLRSRNRIYTIFAFTIGVILTLAATGILRLD
jgi:hypothetical protein